MMSEMMINASAVTRDFSISRGMLRGKQRLKAVNGVDLNVTRGEVLARWRVRMWKDHVGKDPAWPFAADKRFYISVRHADRRGAAS